MTVPAGGTLEIRHQVDPATIAEAGLKAGEKYRASFTNKCLGTRWWAFGSLDELENVRFRQWKDGEQQEGADDEGKYLMGEVPNVLALVIEKDMAEFEILQAVE